VTAASDDVFVAMRRAISEVERLEKEYGLVPVRIEVSVDFMAALSKAIPLTTDVRCEHLGFVAMSLVGVPVVVALHLRGDEWAPVYRAPR
jgi:hypothetical protein